MGEQESYYWDLQNMAGQGEGFISRRQLEREKQQAMQRRERIAPMADKETKAPAAPQQTDAEKEAQRAYDERMKTADEEAARRDRIMQKAEQARFRPVKADE